MVPVTSTGITLGLIIYRFVLTAVVYTYRSVINEGNVHHGLKYAIFDFVFAIKLADLGNKRVVELFAFGSWSGLVEVWFVAFLGRC